MSIENQPTIIYSTPTKEQRQALQQSRLLLSCIANSALIGFNQSLLLILPIALFLPHFSMNMLPVIYTGILLINFIFYHIHQQFKRHVHSARPLFFYNLTAAIIILGLWWDIHYIDHHWNRAILLLISIPFVSLSNLQMSMLNKSVIVKKAYQASYIMKITQLAFIGIGGLIIPLMVFVFDVEDSLPVLSITLAISALFIGLSPKHQQIRKRATSDKTDFHNTLSINSQYIVKLILYSGLGIFCFYCISLVFNTIVKTEFQNSINIAVFLGFFFAVVGITSLILHITMKRYLMNRLSVSTFMYIWPGIILIACLPVLLGASHASFIISAIIGLQLFEEILRNSALDDMQSLLKQPLSRDDRHWLSRRARPSIRLISGLIANICLLLIYYSIGFDIFALMLMIMTAAIVMLYLSPGLKKLYTQNLLHVIGKHHLLSPKFRIMDKTSLGILKSGLKSSHSEVALYSLNIFKKSNKKLFTGAIKKCLEHHDPDVRKQAISLIGEHQLTALISHVNHCLNNDNDLGVQGNALIVIAKLAKKNVLPIIQPYLDSEETEIKMDAVIALLNHGTPDHFLAGLKKLEALSHSPIGSERIIAATILNHTDNSQFYPLLKALLHDNNILVRRKAIAAVSTHPFHPELIDILIHAIRYPQLRTVTMQTLSHFEQSAIPKLLLMLEEYENSPDLFKTVTQLLIQFKSLLIGEELYQYIDHPNPKIRHCILQALHQLNFHLEDKQKKIKMAELLKIESALCVEIIESIRDLEKSSDTSFLIDLLTSQLKQQKENMVYLLSFYYPEKGIIKAWDNLQSSDDMLNTHGAELLDNLLSPSHRMFIIPLLKKQSFDDMINQLPEQFHNDEKGFHDRLLYIVEKITYLNPVIQACALYTATHMQLDNIETILKNKLKHPNPVIRETAIWGLWFCKSHHFKTAIHDMLSDQSVIVANTAKQLFSRS